MDKSGLNVFFIVAFASTLLLTIYLWFVYLPTFRSSPGYSALSIMVSVLTVLLLPVLGIEVFLLRRSRKEKTQ